MKISKLLVVIKELSRSSVLRVLFNMLINDRELYTKTEKGRGRYEKIRHGMEKGQVLTSNNHLLNSSFVQVVKSLSVFCTKVTVSIVSEQVSSEHLERAKRPHVYSLTNESFQLAGI